MERSHGDHIGRADGQDVSLERILQVLRRRWFLIVACVVIVGAASFGFSKLQHKEYTTSASLLFGNTDLASSVSDEASGIGIPQPIDPQRQSANIVLLLTESNTAASTASAIGHGLTAATVASSVSVAPQGQSNVVSVSATSTSPQLAAQIATVYTKQFIHGQRASDRTVIVRAARLVQKQLNALSPIQLAGLQGQALTNRSQALQILASIDDGNVKLVRAAGVPRSPSTAGPLQDAGLGVFVGLVLGLALAFLLERLDHRLKDVDELEAAFAFPVIGHIPERRSFSEPIQGPEPLSLSEDMEAFRMLRAHLRYFNVDRDIKTILVTSIESGDGKTTIARNLAEAAASMGTHTLLVEADLRKPALAGLLGLRPGPGLAEVLSMQGSMSENVQGVPVVNRLNGARRNTRLDVLVAGALPPNPAELLESAQMETLLSSTAVGHELIVIDAPPLSVVSDAIPLLRNVDGVLIVGRLKKNTRDSARRFHAKLKSLGAPVLGVVINAMKDRDSYGYGYYSSLEPHRIDGLTNNPLVLQRDPVDKATSEAPVNKPYRVDKPNSGAAKQRRWQFGKGRKE